MALRGPELIPILVAIAVGALLTMGIALWIAVRSRKPHPKKPPRRTFEHGRRLARAHHVASPRAAVDALERAPVGTLEQARADARGAQVTLVRRRNQPCAQAAGFVAGLFESAWAHEVRLSHPECGGDRGGRCVYVVEKAVPTGSARPGAGAPTPGSASDPGRSLRARAGGG